MNAINFARIDGSRGLLWVTIGVVSSCFVFTTLRAFGHCLIRPQPATTLGFDETGFSLARGGAHPYASHVSCKRVRSVRLTSETVGIYGAWQTYAIIPRTAFPDGGTQVMRFFAERIVSQGLTESTSRGVTTLDNSVTPLFASG